MDLVERSISPYREPGKGMRMQVKARLSWLSPASQARAGDWLMLVVPGLIWGASFLFIAEGMRAIGPWGLTFARILIGFATLSLFPAARRPVLRSDWVGIVWLGVLWLARSEE